jgi:hypothetical protein
MTPEIVARVDARWQAYGFTGAPVPSRFAPKDGVKATTS